jgi:hypothetical protein
MWPYYSGALVVGVGLTAFTTYAAVQGWDWLLYLLVPGWVYVLGFLLWSSRTYGRVMWRVRRFRWLRGGTIELCYAPELEGWVELYLFLRHAERELRRLEEWFGFKLRRPPAIFLFECCNDLGKIFGRPIGGCALSGATSIVIAHDSTPESMTHEFAHLFAGKWNREAAPLLTEGIAVWLQRTESGRPIDELVRSYLYRWEPLLPQLLRGRALYAEQGIYPNYLIAGSFTGFLLRRFGRDRYERLYRLPHQKYFADSFEACFGVTIEEAEREWRQGVMANETLYQWITDGRDKKTMPARPPKRTALQAGIRGILMGMGVMALMVGLLPFFAIWDASARKELWVFGLVPLVLIGAGGFLGLVLTLRDGIDRLQARGELKSFFARAYFTSGWWSMLLWLITLIVGFPLAAIVVGKVWLSG